VQLIITNGKYQNRYYQEGRSETPEKSYILMFYCFEPVLHLGLVSKFSETIERTGYVVGSADNTR
jgi:hypothetical protein